jgi:hypothetical protein
VKIYVGGSEGAQEKGNTTTAEYFFFCFGLLGFCLS